MSKARITRLLVSSVVAGTLGGALIAVAPSAFPYGAFVRAGSDIVGIHGSPTVWALLGLGTAGAFILVGPMIAAPRYLRSMAWSAAVRAGANSPDMSGRGRSCDFRRLAARVSAARVDVWIRWGMSWPG